MISTTYISKFFHGNFCVAENFPASAFEVGTIAYRPKSDQIDKVSKVVVSTSIAPQIPNDATQRNTGI